MKKLFGTLLSGVDNTDDWKYLAGIYFKQVPKYHSKGVKSVMYKKWCKYPKGHRYTQLCSHTRKKANRAFWRGLGSCHKKRHGVLTLITILKSWHLMIDHGIPGLPRPDVQRGERQIQ